MDTTPSRGGSIADERKAGGFTLYPQHLAGDYLEVPLGPGMPFPFGSQERRCVLSATDTAYPLLKSNLSARELDELFPPNLFES